jgi:hypothetical protein
MNAEPNNREILMSIQPAITLEQIEEREAHEIEDGRTRRAMLVMLTRTGPEILDFVRDDESGELLTNLIEAFEAYKSHLRALADLTESVQARLLAAAGVILAEIEDD